MHPATGFSGAQNDIRLKRPLPRLGAEMGPDASTLHGPQRTIRTTWTTAQTTAVQSDVTFSGSYVEGAKELGKLTLYQLSYSRTVTYVSPTSTWGRIGASGQRRSKHEVTSRLDTRTDRRTRSCQRSGFGDLYPHGLPEACSVLQSAELGRHQTGGRPVRPLCAKHRHPGFLE